MPPSQGFIRFSQHWTDHVDHHRTFEQEVRHFGLKKQPSKAWKMRFYSKKASIQSECLHLMSIVKPFSADAILGGRGTTSYLGDQFPESA